MENTNNGTTFAFIFEERILYLQENRRFLRQIINNSTRHYGLSVRIYRAQGISKYFPC